MLLGKIIWHRGVRVAPFDRCALGGTHQGAGLVDPYRHRDVAEAEQLVRDVRGVDQRGMCRCSGLDERASLVRVDVERTDHVLTRALKGGLHLRLISTYEKRRDHIAEIYGLEVQAAAERITALDAGRRAYVKRHFSADVTDPRAYDLIVNTATLSIEDAATMVAARLAPVPVQAGTR